MAEGKILVVDDEKAILDLFIRVLGREGYEVVTAKDGKSALAKFEEGYFNLVMMDIKLPDTDGVKLLKKLKEMDQDIEGMIITGYASMESAIDALKDGASEYITKPFDKIEDVVRVVNRLVEKQKLTVENKRLQEETESQRDELKKRVFELGVLYDVSDAISYTLDYRELLNVIMASVSTVVDYDVCASFILTEKGGNLVTKAAKPVTKDFVKQVEKDVIDAVSSVTGRRIGKKDVSLSSGTIPRPGKGKKALKKVRSFFNIPLIVEDKAMGMLNISSSRENAFSPADIRILYTISNQAATAIGKLRGVIVAEKSKMEAMVESMAEGVIMTDERGELVVLNPTARMMLGFRSDEELTGKKLVEAFGDAGKGKLLARGTDSAEGGEVRTEMALSNPQDRKTLYASQAPVRGEKGEKLGHVTVLRDITKEKEVDRMKTEFISTVSHELRTPLTTIREGVSQVLDGILGKTTKGQKEFLSICLEDVDRLERIIGGLLDISKIEAGKVGIKREGVDIEALAEGVSASFISEAKDKGLEIRRDFPEKAIEVYAEKDKIVQVFTNLVSNALRFTPEGGKITVAIEDKDKEVQCSVSDTGVGIPEDELHKVFDKFHQVERVDGPGAKGTGLGLAITKELIGMHKGRIWAESKLGKGSKFTFTLPKADIEAIFREYLNSGMAEAKKHGIPMSLIVIALANLQKMKEEYKTEGIVKVLKEIGVVVSDTISRPVNLINRYNRGEVAAVLLEAERREVLGIEKKLKKAIKTHQFTLDGEPIKVGVSFGITTYPEEAETEDELIKRLEASLEERRTYKPRVMVVDDEVDLCRGLKIMLEARHYEVVTCNNGKEALEELTRGYSPDLIILDLLMPVMDGYELYMLLKEKRETQDIPVLILTAKGERADKKLGIEFGPYNYITKPFEHKELLDKIEEMVEE